MVDFSARVRLAARLIAEEGLESGQPHPAAGVEKIGMRALWGRIESTSFLSRVRCGTTS
jgi:hypothetical protein